VALNLAPLSCGKFRFAKSKQYLAPSHPSSSIQSSSAGLAIVSKPHDRDRSPEAWIHHPPIARIAPLFLV
jgi:hypothetical protein